jgi:hypothetical protein
MAYKQNDIKAVASDWAEGIAQQIVTAMNSPENGLEGDALKIYRELNDWNWFETFPIDDEAGEKALHMFLSITRHRHLMWHKEHPQKPKISKWERVTGVKKKT